jgi:ElaB/YqjD/DUF883 family membrane-anchored ribosome-binding protein
MNEESSTTPRSAEEIERDIETTRAQMGDTVEALAAKTDVKAKAQQKVAEAKTKVSQTKDNLFGKAQEASPDSASSAAAEAQEKVRQNPLPVAVAAAALGGFVLGRLSKRT